MPLSLQRQAYRRADPTLAGVIVPDKAGLRNKEAGRSLAIRGEIIPRA
jgi:hypothetical protein